MLNPAYRSSNDALKWYDFVFNITWFLDLGVGLKIVRSASFFQPVPRSSTTMPSLYIGCFHFRTKTLSRYSVSDKHVRHEMHLLWVDRGATRKLLVRSSKYIPLLLWKLLYFSLHLTNPPKKIRIISLVCWEGFGLLVWTNPERMKFQPFLAIIDSQEANKY